MDGHPPPPGTPAGTAGAADEGAKAQGVIARAARRCSRDLSWEGEGVVSRLDYASRRMPQAGRGVGYWFLIVLNSITLVIGFIAAGMLYSTTVDRQGLGQVGAFAVAGPMALVEIPIAVVSCRLARRWRDPLAIVSTVSALVNAGAGVALVFVPLGH